MTNYSAVTKLEHCSKDGFGREVKTTIEFDSLDMTYDAVCDKFADFLRATGYSYIKTVIAYQQEDGHDYSQEA